MIGELVAVLSGVGFGVFQAFNRRAVQGMDVFMATFLQLLISAVVLLGLSAVFVSATTFQALNSSAIFFFAIAGALHFFIGWTFLNASQKEIGAARTASLIGTLPIWGAIFAAITLGEVPTLMDMGGILLIVAGVYLVNDSKIHKEVAVVAAVNASPTASPALSLEQPVEHKANATGLRSLRFGLAAALCWSLSPTFIRYGLNEVPDPLLGVTIGIVASAMGYAVIVLFRKSRDAIGPIEMTAFGYKVFAAVLVALATWLRWVSLSLVPVAVALALSLVSVPVVNFLSPIVSGRHLERVTTQVWGGSALIIAGSLILIFSI